MRRVTGGIRAGKGAGDFHPLGVVPAKAGIQTHRRLALELRPILKAERMGPGLRRGDDPAATVTLGVILAQARIHSADALGVAKDWLDRRRPKTLLHGSSPARG
ncbi:hypothetical protein ABIE08_002757 [Kaistia defluvii]|uniref:Transposase n=1 Tax=Kaistia defluvii TaxID=410841 RepID=A0ABV2R294_9HYPH